MLYEAFVTKYYITVTLGWHDSTFVLLEKQNCQDREVIDTTMTSSLTKNHTLINRS